jgi:hypothetical protein
MQLFVENVLLSPPFEKGGYRGIYHLSGYRTFASHAAQSICEPAPVWRINRRGRKVKITFRPP